MSHRTLPYLLVAIAALGSACTTDWPPEIDAALDAGEAQEADPPNAGPEPARLPQGDPLPNDGEWTDIGWGVGFPNPERGAVHVDRIVVTDDQLTLEATFFNLRDTDWWVQFPLHRPRIASGQRFSIRPEEQRFVGVPADELSGDRGRAVRLSSGGSVQIVAVFARPLADAPASVEIHGFEPVPLDLD